MPFTGHTSRYCLPLAMLIAGLAAGSEAFGSCGDYLYSAHRGEMTSDSSTAVSHHDTTNQTATAPFPKPCNGPGCRNAPTTPSETAPIAAPHRIDHSPAVASLDDAQSPRPDAQRRLNLEASEDRTGHARRIDRPPRTRV